jgi:hypothetical protein
MSMFAKYYAKENETEEVEEVKQPTIKVSKLGIPKVYLYVPFAYKEQAKKYGAQWDNDKKKWYTFMNNKYYQKLVDIFYECNFYDDFHGTHLRAKIVTEKQRIECRKKVDQEYDTMKQEYRKNIESKRKWKDSDEYNFGKI